MIRMPEWFHSVDMVICLIYLIEYSLKLYVAPSRFNYFIKASSLMNILLIIMPPLVFPYGTIDFGLFLQSLSRLLRI